MKQQPITNVVREVEAHFTDKLTKSRNTFKRFPLLFTLLGTFGVSITLYGVQNLINKVPYLSRNPVLALIVGLLILIFTGTLYKKL